MPPPEPTAIIQQEKLQYKHNQSKGGIPVMPIWMECQLCLAITQFQLNVLMEAPLNSSLHRSVLLKTAEAASC